MKKLLVLCALCCAIICPAQAAEASFSDVAPDAWYAPYVEVCTEAGIMRGVGEGRFEPERSLRETRPAICRISSGLSPPRIRTEIFIGP